MISDSIGCIIRRHIIDDYDSVVIIFLLDQRLEIPGIPVIDLIIVGGRYDTDRQLGCDFRYFILVFIILFLSLVKTIHFLDVFSWKLVVVNSIHELTESDLFVSIHHSFLTSKLSIIPLLKIQISFLMPC